MKYCEVGEMPPFVQFLTLLVGLWCCPLRGFPRFNTAHNGQVSLFHWVEYSLAVGLCFSHLFPLGATGSSFSTSSAKELYTVKRLHILFRRAEIKNTKTVTHKMKWKSL